MSNELTSTVRMTIEVEMDDYQRDQLEISKNTQVLGGNIVRLDWEGVEYLMRSMVIANYLMQLIRI